MCKVITFDRKNCEDFIFYNHIYQMKDSDFTIEDLKKELKDKYSLEIDEQCIKDKLSHMISNGLISHRGSNCYRAMY